MQAAGSVGYLSIGLTVCFALLGFLSTSVAFYCLIVILLNWMDFRGNAIIQDNLRKFLADASLEPPKNATDRDFTPERRGVARTYWLERWQLARIVVMMFINVAALTIYVLPLLLPAIYDWVAPGIVDTVREGLAVALLISGIVWNRVVLDGWRRDRDARLSDIARREHQAIYTARSR